MNTADTPVSAQPQLQVAKKTSARQERKRLLDREAQRLLRERNKQRIADLEETVEKLTRLPTDERQSALHLQLDQQRKEIDHLKSVLRNVGKLVQNVDDPKQVTDTASPEGAANNDANKAEASTDSGLAFRQLSRSPRNQPVPSYSYHGPAAMNPLSQLGATSSSLKYNASMPASRLHFPILDPSTSIQGILACNHANRNYFAALSDAMTRLHNTGRSSYFSSPEDDDDIVIRVVLHGWENTKRRCVLDVGWQLLEEVDRGILHGNGFVERLVLLRVMRVNLVFNVRPVNQPRRIIPQFLIPSHVQRTTAHLPLIDYFPWPYCRDAMILAQVSYGTETSALLFAKSTHFVWPYRIEDIFVHHAATSRYYLTPAFVACFNNPDCWQLLADMQAILSALNTSPGDRQSEITSTQDSSGACQEGTGIMMAENLSLQPWGPKAIALPEHSMPGELGDANIQLSRSGGWWSDDQ